MGLCHLFLWIIFARGADEYSALTVGINAFEVFNLPDISYDTGVRLSFLDDGTRELGDQVCGSLGMTDHARGWARTSRGASITSCDLHSERLMNLNWRKRNRIKLPCPPEQENELCHGFILAEGRASEFFEVARDLFRVQFYPRNSVRLNLKPKKNPRKLSLKVTKMAQECLEKGFSTFVTSIIHQRKFREGDTRGMVGFLLADGEFADLHWVGKKQLDLEDIEIDKSELSMLECKMFKEAQKLDGNINPSRVQRRRFPIGEQTLTIWSRNMKFRQFGARPNFENFITDFNKPLFLNWEMNFLMRGRSGVRVTAAATCPQLNVASLKKEVTVWKNMPYKKISEDEVPKLGSYFSPRVEDLEDPRLARLGLKFIKEIAEELMESAVLFSCVRPVGIHYGKKIASDLQIYAKELIGRVSALKESPIEVGKELDGEVRAMISRIGQHKELGNGCSHGVSKILHDFKAHLGKLCEVLI